MEAGAQDACAPLRHLATREEEEAAEAGARGRDARVLRQTGGTRVAATTTTRTGTT